MIFSGVGFFCYFVFVLCLVPNVASVSGLSIHHCPLQFSITLCLVPNVASVSGLSIHHCHLRFSLTFYVLFPMLPVSLDCAFIIALYGFLCCSMSCSQCFQYLWAVHSSLPSAVFSNVLCLVPNVASVSGLGIHHCPLRFSLTFYVLFPMLPVFLDCPFIIALYSFL